MRYVWTCFGVTLLGGACILATRGIAGETPTERPKAPTVTERPAACPNAGHSATILKGIANGRGNQILVENDGERSTTVIQNARNGVGNRIVVVDGQVVTDLSDAPPLLKDAASVGSLSFYSPLHGCTLYWNPRTLSWCRYDKAREQYVPVQWDEAPQSPDRE